MATQKITKSNRSILEALYQVSLMDPAYVTWVEQGESVVVTYSGGHTYSAAGGFFGCWYAGEEPEYLGPAQSPHPTTQYVSFSAGMFRLKAPCVVTYRGGDHIGGREREFQSGTIVCATPQQIAEAAAVVLQQRRDECANADLGALAEFLKVCWRDADVWHRKQDWGQQHGLAPETYRTPENIKRELESESNRPDSSVGEYLIPKSRPQALMACNRMMYFMTVGERLAWFAKIEAEYAAEVEANKKAFAKAQVVELQVMGLSAQDAWKLIRVASASGAVECYRWIQGLLKVEDRATLKKNLSKVALATKQLGAWSIMMDTFDHFGIARAPGGYQQIVRNLHAAQMFGLVGKNVKF